MEFAAPKNIQQPNNFNALRLILALYVFLCHFVDLSAIDTPLMFLDGPDAVRGFFVISGFLIYSSYCRSSSLKSYFIKRGRRIFPSYFFYRDILFGGAVFCVVADSVGIFRQGLAKVSAVEYGVLKLRAADSSRRIRG